MATNRLWREAEEGAHKREIIQHGNSLAFTIPYEDVQQYDLTKHDQVAVKQRPGGLDVEYPDKGGDR